MMASHLMYLIGLITIALNSLVQSATLDSYVSVVLHDDLSLLYGDELHFPLLPLQRELLVLTLNMR